MIGPNSFCPGIVSPQRSNARPNFPTSNVVGGAKFVWHPGYISGVCLTEIYPDIAIYIYVCMHELVEHTKTHMHVSIYTHKHITEQTMQQGDISP